MSQIDNNRLNNLKAQLRKMAFVPTSMLGQDPSAGQDPAAGAPGMSPGGAPPTSPGGTPDPSAMGGMPGMDPTQSTGGGDPNMPGGGAPPQAAMGGAAGGKGSGKINDITFLASEVGEVKGRMNLMIELLQGQMMPPGGKAASVKVDTQTLHTLLQLLKME